MDDLIVFNKPCGVVCQFGAHEKHRSLKDFIDAPGFYPAGRLDTDSEGLLLLTCNGRMQARIAHPKFKLEKTYWAQLEGSLQADKLAALQRPMDLGDFVARPAKIRLPDAGETDALWPRVPPVRFRLSVPTAWLELSIREGRNRQVRRMTAAVGLPTLRLVRVQVGDWSLRGLQSGAWKKVHV